MREKANTYYIKIILRNLCIAFCAIVYCASIFNSTAVSLAPDQATHQEYSQKKYFGEISKLVFPQSVNTETPVQSFVPVFLGLTDEFNRVLLMGQALNQRSTQTAINYLKKETTIVRSLTIKEIIFPFHYYW